MRKGFTLIELLIVVAIIAILAAIAVPNFLEAQTRAKVARCKADLRTIATGVESYRVDNNHYPDGTDSPTGYDERISSYLQNFNLQAGYYGFRTRTATSTVGVGFAGVTTPIAYITSIPTDIFSGEAASFFTYCYRPAKATRGGYVLTSAGPDNDLLAPNGKGTNNPNVLGTRADPKVPAARLADINEAMVISFIEGKPSAPATDADLPFFRPLLEDLTYDPTNGTISDGDLVRVGP